jgi:hypothetical protein
MSSMSHHFDTSTAREDPRLNLCDFYLFAGEPDSTVMAMTVNPEVDLQTRAPFRDEGLYAFRFDTNRDCREDISFKVRFGGADDDRAQSVEVRRGIRDDAVFGTDGVLLATGMTGQVITADTGVQVFAGVTPDPFGHDASAPESVKAAFARGGYAPEAFDSRMNSFEPRHVAAIVLEVPNELIGVGLVHSWATISLCGQEPEIQVARRGLQSFDYTGFGGRGPHDGVMDTMLPPITNSAPADGAAPDTARPGARFPYFSTDHGWRRARSQE